MRNAQWDAHSHNSIWPGYLWITAKVSLPRRRFPRLAGMLTCWLLWRQNNRVQSWLLEAWIDRQPVQQSPSRMRKLENDRIHWLMFVLRHAIRYLIYASSCRPLWQETFCTIREHFVPWFLSCLVEFGNCAQHNGLILYCWGWNHTGSRALDFLHHWNVSKGVFKFCDYHNVHLLKAQWPSTHFISAIYHTRRHILDILQYCFVSYCFNSIVFLTGVARILLCEREIWWV